MNSAGYTTNTCDKCLGHRYLEGTYEYTLPSWKVGDFWFDYKDRVLCSELLWDRYGGCLGCLRVAKASYIVIGRILYKLGVDL
jgi:hypothetical protein